MKRKLKFLGGLSCGILICGILVGLNRPSERAGASVINQTLMSDNFNSGDYKGTINPSIWETSFSESSKISQTATGETYLSQSGVSNGVEFYYFTTKEKQTNIKKVTFDCFFKTDAANTNKWIGIFFSDKKEDVFTNGSTGYDLAYNGSMGRLAFNNLYGVAATKTDGSNLAIALNSEYGIGVETWMTVEYQITSATTGTINFAIQGEEMSPATAKEFKVTATGKNAEYPFNLENAFFSLCVSNEAGEIRFDNLKIESDQTFLPDAVGGGTYFVENFDNCDPLDEESRWDIIANTKVGKELKNHPFKFVDNCSLTFENSVPGDFIYSKKAIEDNTNGVHEVNVFEISFKVKINNNDDKIGIVIGYNPELNSLTKNTLVYELDRYNGVLKEYDAGGNCVKEYQNKFVSNLSSEHDITISYSVKNGLAILDGDKAVSLSGVPVVYGIDKVYTGRLAIACLSRTSSAGKICYIDSLLINTNSYYRPVTKSVTHDFSSDYFGAEGHEDFIIVHENSEVTNDVYVDKERGKLVFNGASDNAKFGSAHQYDDFILDFKLTSLFADPNVTQASPEYKSITQRGAWFGLDLSRENKMRSAYGDYLTILSFYNPEETKDVAVNGYYSNSTPDHGIPEGVTLSYNKSIPMEMYRAITYKNESEKTLIDEGDAICFRYVSEGGNLSMYAKKASDINYTKYITLKNVKLQGYFAICCTGFSFFEIDDFTMTNTSPIYEIAETVYPDPIVVIETEFVNQTDNNAVNLEEEISLNESKGSILPVIILSCTTGIFAVSTVVLLVLRKKKHEKE